MPSKAHNLLKKLGLIVMSPAFEKAMKSLVYALPLCAIAIAMYILLGYTQREFDDIDSSHFQRAIKEVVELRTDEIDRYNALPDGTLVAIHGSAEVDTQLLSDPIAGISGTGFLLERQHQYLRTSYNQTVRTVRNTRTVTTDPRMNREWLAVDTDFLPSQTWPAPNDTGYRFGPINALPRTPGKRTAMFPDETLMAQLHQAGFRTREDDCLVKPQSSESAYPPTERICWFLYQAQAQTYVGAKRGPYLDNWSVEAGTVISKLTELRVDPRIDWKAEIAMVEKWNAMPRSLTEFIDYPMLPGRMFLLVTLSLAYLWLSLMLIRYWMRHLHKAEVNPPRSARLEIIQRISIALLLGMAGPVLLYFCHGSWVVFYAFFALWLIAPPLFWWRTERVANKAATAQMH